MKMQWVRVTRGFWHAGQAWGEGELLQVDGNTANLLRGNGNVAFADAPPAPPVTAAQAVEPSPSATKRVR